MRVRIRGGAARFLRDFRPIALLNAIAQRAWKPGQNSSNGDSTPDLDPASEDISKSEETTETVIAPDGAQIDCSVPLSDSEPAHISADPSPVVADSSVSFGGLELSYNAVSHAGLVRSRNEDACGL